MAGGSGRGHPAVELKDITARDISIHDINIVYRLPEIEAQEHRKLLILLTKVKQFWIEGVLDMAVTIKPPLGLNKEVLSDVVEHPWEKVVGLPGATSRSLPSEKNILDVFDELGRALLILGVPGSGKTITLLELARDLIARAENDPNHPFPVVVNLSTWIDPRQSLFDWLANEIRDKYKIPEKFTRAWLEDNRLLLLLDGLDEVKAVNRAACVEAINAFAREYGLPGVVVTSRLEEYSQLPVRLELHAAILLKPLTDSQINTYLARAGSKLAALQGVLQIDPVLRNQAQFPLMLSIMSMAYSLAPQDLIVQDSAAQKTEDIETRRKYLFEAYIDAMFRRKGKTQQPFTKGQTISRLSWLAQRMTQHNQTVFLIEGMQSSWLKGWGQRWAYLLSFSLVFGFFAAQFSVIGWHAWGKLSVDVAKTLAEEIDLWVWIVGCIAWILSIGIIDLFTFDRRIEPAQAQAKTKIITRQAVINILIYGLTWSAIWAVIGYACNLWDWVVVDYPNQGDTRPPMLLPAISGLVLVVMLGVVGSRHSVTRDIRTAEAVGWSWPGAFKGCLWGFAGTVLVCSIWFPYWPPPEFQPPNWLSSIPMIQPYLSYYPKIVFPLACLIIGVEAGAIFIGLRYRILETKTVPNQGIMLSIKNVIKVGFFCWAIYTLTIWGILTLFRPETTFIDNKFPHDGELFSFFLGMSFFWVSALLLGGVEVLKHYTLRSILYLTGQIPGRFRYFLDHASRINLLQKVGGGYIFIHRLLLEHFAAKGETRKDNAAE